jgi:enoyl-CoA hydratase/carnithine racemase
VSVEWERRGSAAWITFNRPEAHNAMTFAMYEELFELCERADADDSVRSVVLRGAGRKAFVAGTDIRQFAEFSSGEDGLRYEAEIDRVVGRLEAVRKPTIAIVHGYAMGSGLILAAVCDFRFCSPEARFGMPIARTVGNCLSMANYARLTALIGEAHVKNLVLTAGEVGAGQATMWGLVTQVMEHPETWVEEQLIPRLAENSPVTIRVTKEALRRLRAVPDGDDLVREAYESDEFRARVAAFLKR